MPTLSEILAAIKAGQLPRNNAVINEGIADYIAAQKERRLARRNKSDADFMAQPGMATAYSNALGVNTPEQQASEAVGRILGATNPAIKSAPTKGYQINLPIGGQPGSVSRVPNYENISTQPPQGQPTLADFIRNPSVGAQAQATIESERKATQEVIKNNLQLQRQASIERLKADLKKRKVTSPDQLTPNEIANLLKAFYPLGDVPEDGVQKAFQQLYGTYNNDIPVAKQDAGLSAEANEVMAARKKRKK